MPLCEIPSPGLGTWRNTFPGRCDRSIATAIDIGYLHIDTARAYGNESYVGEGVRMSTVDRDDVFVATKVHPERLRSDDVRESVEKSLSELGFETIDLLYVHWPAISYNAEETWAVFNELRDEGVVCHLGASNFTADLLDEARSVSEAPIVANQVELHPLNQQPELVEYAQEHDMYLVAYSPIARGRVFEIPELTAIATKHDASEAQVSLAWLLSMDNVVPIPMADIEVHQRENYQAAALELDPEDIETIESIGRQRRLVNPEYAPWRE